MTWRPPATMAFLGFGLIGGSIAQALASDPHSGAPRERPRIVAWTPHGKGPAAAVRDGVIDLAAGSPREAIDGADVVVLAAPPIDVITLVRRLGSDLAPSLSRAAIVTDVASTKGAVMTAAADAGLRFVGGHPMAGRESSGYEAATRDLFVDRPWAIVPPVEALRATEAEHGGRAAAGARVTRAAEFEDAVEAVHWLALQCGANPVDMSAASHDAATAAISHIPLVVAAALVEALHARGTASLADGTRLAASGWASATRLALGDPRMGAGIVATNGPEIAAQLRALRAVLDSWLADLGGEGGPDIDALEVRFSAARANLVTMNEPPA